ncbi:UNVERIFIED_CONTAM: hypothetical protein RMT77_004079 [Armadillidium vulgare]
MFRLIVTLVFVAQAWGFPDKLAPLPNQYLPPSPGTPPPPPPPPSSYVITAPPPEKQYGAPPVECDQGFLLDAYGNCVEPEVVRDLYVFQEPADEEEEEYKEPIPPPQVKLNLVVIRTNDGDQDTEPIIIPPPQEKTLVLVLSKKGDPSKQVIEVPAREGQKPEVFFVDYAPGDNTLLPGGIYLQDALQYAASVDGGDGSGPSETSPPNPGYY